MVITDPVKHLVEVTIEAGTFLTTTVDKVEPVSPYSPATHPVPPPALSAADVTASSRRNRSCARACRTDQASPGPMGRPPAGAPAAAAVVTEAHRRLGLVFPRPPGGPARR